VTCGLTACIPGSALGPTLGNECDDDDADADAGGCVRNVVNASWCLAVAHLSEGLLCVTCQSSVIVCCVTATAGNITLSQLHTISVTALPQGDISIAAVYYLSNSNNNNLILSQPKVVNSEMMAAQVE